jgi:hypothetical protein
MSDEKPNPIEPVADRPTMKVVPGEPERRRDSRSLFAPIVLIAGGVLFLLDNLGLIANLNWQAALQYWPVALIFLGLNVLVVQFRRPLGTILSLLVALAAVVVFGFLLVRGAPVDALRSFGIEAPAAADLREESFNLTPGAAETAEVTIHLGNYPSHIEAGDGADLIAGTIWTRTALDMRPGSEGDSHITVEVGEEPGGLTLNFADWTSEARTWEFFLSPELPIDLTLDAGNAPLTADLAALALSNLVIDGGNSSTTAGLPDGDYDIRIDGGNGRLDVALPAGGGREVRVDGGNGGIDLVLPQGVEARVEYNRGNGGVHVDGRFERVAGDNDEGAYETAGYRAGQGVLLIVETGNGGVSVGN